MRAKCPIGCRHAAPLARQVTAELKNAAGDLIASPASGTAVDVIPRLWINDVLLGRPAASPRLAAHSPAQCPSNPRGDRPGTEHGQCQAQWMS